MKGNEKARKTSIAQAQHQPIIYGERRGEERNIFYNVKW